MSAPLPVSAAADARAVIALGFDALMPQQVNKPSRLLAQTTSAMTNNLMCARLAAPGSDGMWLLRIFPRLVWCCVLDGTNKTDGFFGQD